MFDTSPTSEQNAVVTRTSLLEIVACRDAALAEYDRAADLFAAAADAATEASKLKSRAAHGARVYMGESHSAIGAQLKTKIDPAEAKIWARREVDSGVWMHIFDTYRFGDLMDADMRKQWLAQVKADPIEVTFDNLEATISNIMAQQDDVFVRGIANCFAKLDRRFASHDAFKFGNRMIFEGMFDEFGFSGHRSDYIWSVISDVERVLCILDKAPEKRGDVRASVDKARAGGFVKRQSESETDYFKIRTFKKGSIHLWFKRKDLVERVNQMLSDWYGCVLPDAAESTEHQAQATSTAVSKDLQFYGTSDATGDRLLKKIHFPEGASILEPSVGEGALVAAILRRYQKQHEDKKHGIAGLNITAVEFDKGRAKKTYERFDGAVDVRCQNFLEFETAKRFDFTVMNPPFYGTHWMDHVQKAWELTSGTLIAILPATAEIGTSKKHKEFLAWVKKETGRDPWFTALPAGSFADAGTNVSTVVLRMQL